MNAQQITPGNRKAIDTILPAFSGLRNSLHLKALSEFFVAAKRGDASKLLITILLALLLAIPATVLILSNGLNNASDNLKQARRISVFMAPATSEPAATQLANMLIANKHVSNVTLIPPRPEWSDTEAPQMLEVSPEHALDTHSVTELADQLGALAGVEFVELNVDRLKQTQSALNLLGHLDRIANVTALIAAALLMLLVCYHDIQKSRTTIKLMKQLGGTLADVRRPFLYRGPTLGIFAGILGISTAIAIIWAIANFVAAPAFAALIPLKPSLTQLVLFLAIVTIASIAATIRIFTKIFTVYKQ